jgi:hypothetical protein
MWRRVVVARLAVSRPSAAGTPRTRSADTTAAEITAAEVESHRRLAWGGGPPGSRVPLESGPPGSVVVPVSGPCPTHEFNAQQVNPRCAGAESIDDSLTTRRMRSLSSWSLKDAPSRSSSIAEPWPDAPSESGSVGPAQGSQAGRSASPLLRRPPGSADPQSGRHPIDSGPTRDGRGRPEQRGGRAQRSPRPNDAGAWPPGQRSSADRPRGSPVPAEEAARSWTRAQAAAATRPLGASNCSVARSNHKPDDVELSKAIARGGAHGRPAESSRGLPPPGGPWLRAAPAHRHTV